MYSKIVQQLTNWWIGIFSMKITVTKEWCRQGLKKYMYSKCTQQVCMGWRMQRQETDHPYQLKMLDIFYWLFLQQLKSFKIIFHQSIHTELCYLLPQCCFSVLPSGWSCWPWFTGGRWWGWKHNYSDREEKHWDKKIYTGCSGPQARHLSLIEYHVQKGLRHWKGSTFSSRWP